MEIGNVNVYQSCATPMGGIGYGNQPSRSSEIQTSIRNGAIFYDCK
jgi:hypothetical protein